MNKDKVLQLHLEALKHNQEVSLKQEQLMNAHKENVNKQLLQQEKPLSKNELKELKLKEDEKIIDMIRLDTERYH